MQTGFFYFLLLYILIGQYSFARLIKVNTSDGFKSACVNSIPGDTIELADGIYNTDGSITLYSSGTADQPILIRAKNIGKAELTGDTYFDLRQCEYITFR